MALVSSLLEYKYPYFIYKDITHNYRQAKVWNVIRTKYFNTTTSGRVASSVRVFNFLIYPTDFENNFVLVLYVKFNFCLYASNITPTLHHCNL
jgi:hypothetical protein